MLWQHASMRIWPRRAARTPPHEVIDVHPGVPPLTAWGRNGIVGTIGSGSAAGATVVAHPRRTERGALDFDELEVWDRPGPVLDDDGRFVMDDWVTDDCVPGTEGGLVDALTREVDVTWWTDRERLDAFWSTHRDRR